MSLVELHIFRQVQTAEAAELLYLREAVFRIDLGRLLLQISELDVAASHGDDAGGIHDLPALKRQEIHGVWMGDVRRRLLTENNLRGNGGEHLMQDPVGPVTLSGFAEGLVQPYLEGIRIWMRLPEAPGRPLRTDGVGAGRPLADFVKLSNGFHATALRHAPLRISSGTPPRPPHPPWAWRCR